MRKFDAGAKGLVLFCGSGPPPFVALRYVSTSPDAGQRFIHMRAQDWGCSADAERRIPPLARVNADAVEERYRINASRDDALRHAKWLSVEATAASELTFLPNFGFSLKDL